MNIHVGSLRFQSRQVIVFLGGLLLCIPEGLNAGFRDTLGIPIFDNTQAFLRGCLCIIATTPLTGLDQLPRCIEHTMNMLGRPAFSACAGRPLLGFFLPWPPLLGRWPSGRYRFLPPRWVVGWGQRDVRMGPKTEIRGGVHREWANSGLTTLSIDFADEFCVLRSEN